MLRRARTWSTGHRACPPHGARYLHAPGLDAAHWCSLFAHPRPHFHAPKLTHSLSAARLSSRRGKAQRRQAPHQLCHCLMRAPPHRCCLCLAHNCATSPSTSSTLFQQLLSFGEGVFAIFISPEISATMAWRARRRTTHSSICFDSLRLG